MSNFFDGLAKQTFDRVNTIFGTDAVWLSGKSRRTKEAGKVLFKDPTEPVQIGSAEKYEYRPETATLEYYTGTFDGLKKAVDNGTDQYIRVNGQKYHVIQITTKYDGQTFVAHLEPHTD